MFKIPNKLKIGGHMFKVVQVKSKSNQDEMGSCDTSKNIITIDSGMVHDQKEATLIHEIFHAMNTTFDGTNNFSHALLDSLAEQIYQVMKDNKLFREDIITQPKDKKQDETKTSNVARTSSVR